MEMGEKEIYQFLTYLAVNRHAAASTQNQVLCAIVFLYKHVLKKELNDLRESYGSKKPRRLPVVFTAAEKAWHRNAKHIPRNKQFSVKIMYGERELGQKVRSLGGVWDRERKIWRVSWEAIQALGIEDRIIIEDGDISNIRNRKRHRYFYI